ncbi:MAG: tetratricopeptide repeat protein [Calditrichaeota bacterium]|nr:tetratricopeptide repeat protein [Calditrichota bacterium]
MLKKLVYVLAVIILGGGVWYAFFHNPRSVTTHSKAAYQEFLEGKEAANKFYNNEAEIHFAKAISLDSNFAMAYLYLGGIYKSQTNKKRLAERYLKKAKELASTVSERERWIIFMNLAPSEKKREAYLDSLLQKYNNTVEPHLAKAGMAMRKMDYKTAEQEFKRILQINPNYAMAYNMLGYLASQQGKTTEAIAYFKKYIFIAPDEANPHDSLGELLLLIGRYDEAIAEFKKALAIRPELATERSILADAIRYHFAEAYFFKGMFQKSLDYLKKGEALSSNSEYSLQMPGLQATIYYQIGNYKKSLQVIEQTKYTVPVLVLLKGLNAFKLHDNQLLEQCLTNIQTDTSAQKRNSRAYKLIFNYLVGKKALETGKYSRAIPLFLDFQKFPAASIFIVRDLSWAYYKNGEPDSAFAVIHRALKINPNSTDAYFSLARIYYDQGNYAEAKQAAEHYFKIYSARDQETPDTRDMQTLLNRAIPRIRHRLQK